MVGFEFFSQECPSVSFFFARLGVFMGYSSGRHPQVSLFVSHSTALKPILFSLYPLIRHSLIKHHLDMATIEYREDDVRSSELETRLSSNAESLCKVVDTAASKMPSSSSHPLCMPCSAVCFSKEKQLNGFRKKILISQGHSIRLHCPSEKACSFAHGEVCFYKADFLCGFHFPVHPFIMQLLHNFQICPG